ncbi:hypothetical protein MTO96_050128, partial [Rhipicephalus appendiculatus]
MAGCEEYRTSRNDLHWDTTRGTLYCVLVSATARCGGNLITGRPVAAEVMAHFSASPRVTNLSLVSAKDRSFTLSWKRPREKFDYYRVQVTSSGGVLNVGSCANGTIIDASRTRVTCDNVEDCRNVTFGIR